MHSILTALASESLRPFVSYYSQREELVPGEARTEPGPAHIHSALEFQFRDRYDIRYFDSEYTHAGPRVAVIGPQTYRRTRLLIRGHMEGFVVVFRPSGFYQLFGAEMCLLMDRSYDAGGVIGHQIEAVWHQLGEASSFRDRIRIIEDFLKRRAPGGDLGIAALSRHIVKSRGAVRISDLACQSGLSARQLERRFRVCTGLSPKAYSRITRYESALRIKASSPERSWGSIAHELSYSDQMHMVHDFHDLSGETPSRALTLVSYGLSLKPKAWFSFAPADAAAPLES